MNARQFDPYQLPQCLARPLARGWLNWVQADAALALAAVRHTGSADDWDGVHRILRFLLIQHLKREEARVNAAQGGIWRTVRRLVQDRAPVNRILAEAHDVNGGQGFPLLAIAMAPIIFLACFLSLNPPTFGPW